MANPLPQPQPQLRRKVAPGYQLNDDIDRGYRDAVQGNQTNMALRYLELIMERQEAKIDALTAEIAELKSAKPQAQQQKPKPEPKPEPTNS